MRYLTVAAGTRGIRSAGLLSWVSGGTSVRGLEGNMRLLRRPFYESGPI
jgi:hypothetical protein